MPRTLGQAIGFLLGLWFAIWLSPFGANADSLTSASALEADLHARVLAIRDREHLIPLIRRADLDEVARAHAADMARRGYMDHTTPEGRSPVDRMREGGIDGFALAAENIGKTSQSNPTQAVVDGWVASPGHRDNLHAPPFNATGIGVARAADGSYLYTQIYATFPR